ncbi:MAG: Flp family type IVb pilin [Terriglobia bacterium]
MRKRLTQLRDAGRELLADESGQDLVEYAIVAALIALGATASMGAIAKSINDIFSSIAVKFRSAGS